MNMTVGAVNERQKMENYEDNKVKVDDRNGELRHDR